MSNVLMNDMRDFYAVHSELELWEMSWKNGYENVKYDNIANTLNNCTYTAFPNIFAALKILSVIPVTTCECERTVSALCCMKT